MFRRCFEADYGIVVVAQAKTLKWIYPFLVYCFMFDTVGMLACYSVKSLKSHFAPIKALAHAPLARTHARARASSTHARARASSGVIIEFKLHVYGKRQTSDSSWEVFKTENEQIKTAQNNFYGWKITVREITTLGVEIINSKRQVKRKLGHAVQIRVCRWT